MRPTPFISPMQEWSFPMSKAYLNALAEEGTRQELIDWLVKKDSEVDKLILERAALYTLIRDPGRSMERLKGGEYNRGYDEGRSDLINELGVAAQNLLEKNND